jgi:hypothetical protein
MRSRRKDTSEAVDVLCLRRAVNRLCQAGDAGRCLDQLTVISSAWKTGLTIVRHIVASTVVVLVPMFWRLP